VSAAESGSTDAKASILPVQENAGKIPDPGIGQGYLIAVQFLL
jgi:hypothetical protein